MDCSGGRREVTSCERASANGTPAVQKRAEFQKQLAGGIDLRVKIVQVRDANINAHCIIRVCVY